MTINNNKILITSIIAITAILGISAIDNQQAHAASFTAVQSGDWDDSATWGGATPPITIGSGDTVTIPGPHTVTIPAGVTINVNSGGTLTNSGTINNNGIIDNSGTINNNGIIDNSGTINNNGSIDNSGTINNNFGTINVNSGGFINVNSGGNIFNNSSTINVNSGGTLTNSGGFIDNLLGTINVELFGTINVNSGGFIFDSGGTINSCPDDLTGTISFLYTVTACDVTSPIITLNGANPITLEAAVDTYTEPGATVADDDPDYSGAVTVGGDTVDTSTLGTYVVTYDAPADDAGNAVTQETRTVNVVDTTPPVVTVPADISVFASQTHGNDGGTAVTFAAATATDNLDPDPSIVCNPASGELFALGTTTVTCTASDFEGNEGTATFDVTVTDNTNPAVTPPADVSVFASETHGNDGGTAVTFGDPTATDNVGVTTGPTCNPASGDLFDIGTTTVTCTASDDAGNEGSATFTVEVKPLVIFSSDVKPGSDKNPINLKSKGVIPVAILGSASFDVADIDADTLKFGPNEATMAHKNGPHYEDVNNDGITDLLSHYKTQKTGISSGDTEACISFEVDGDAQELCDDITVKG